MCARPHPAACGRRPSLLLVGDITIDIVEGKQAVVRTLTCLSGAGWVLFACQVPSSRRHRVLTAGTQAPADCLSSRCMHGVLEELAQLQCSPKRRATTVQLGHVASSTEQHCWQHPARAVVCKRADPAVCGRAARCPTQRQWPGRTASGPALSQVRSRWARCRQRTQLLMAVHSQPPGGLRCLLRIWHAPDQALCSPSRARP